MTKKKPLSIAKVRRVPRNGRLFPIIRVLSVFLLGVSTLILLGSIVGFFILLIKSAPTLGEIIGHHESRISGFVFIGILVWLAAPMVSAFFGVIVSGMGILLYLVATQPAEVRQIDK